jgi:hypothetical protein
MNPRAGFLHIFPESPLRSCAICENLPDMNLGHCKRQKTANRSHELRQVVRGNASGLSDRVLLERIQASDEVCAVDVALCEKPYELPSSTIWSAENSVICRLLSNFKSGLTVKSRNKIPLRAIDPERPDSLPLNCLHHSQSLENAWLLSAPLQFYRQVDR